MSFRSSKNGDNILPFPGQRTLVAPDSTPLLPVLIVLHQETSTPGRVGNALRALGHPLDIRRPRFGDPLPDTLDRHAGAVIFGGPMSANDPDPFVRFGSARPSVSHFVSTQRPSKITYGTTMSVMIRAIST